MNDYSSGLKEGLSDGYAKGYAECCKEIQSMIDGLYLNPRTACAEFEGEVEYIKWDDQIDGAQIVLLFLKDRIKGLIELNSSNYHQRLQETNDN